MINDLAFSHQASIVATVAGALRVSKAQVERAIEDRCPQFGGLFTVSGTVTLRGTYTEDLVGLPVGQPCAPSVSGTYGGLGTPEVQVFVDDVYAASVPVTWLGEVFSQGDGVGACTGTWEATVPVARITYVLKITGGEETFATTVSPANAAEPIAISNE